MAAAAAASMGAAPVEAPAEPAAAGGSGGTCADVPAATGSTVGTHRESYYVPAGILMLLWPAAMEEPAVHAAACGLSPVVQLCSTTTVLNAAGGACCAGKLSQRLGWNWRQGKPGTFRQMSGVLPCTMSCHVTGACAV